MSGSIERPSFVQLLNLWDIAGDRPNERVEITGNHKGNDFCIQGRIMSVVTNSLIPEPRVTVEIQTSEDEQRTMLRLNLADYAVRELPKINVRIDSEEIYSVSWFSKPSIAQRELLCYVDGQWLQKPVVKSKPVIKPILDNPIVKSKPVIKPILDNPSDFLGGC